MSVQEPIIAANWKCCLDWYEVQSFRDWLSATKLSKGHLACFPSDCYLSYLASQTQPSVTIGAQNISVHEKGAFTGEVAAFQLKSLGVERVLIGHSERRHVFHETSGLLSQKLSQLVAHNLVACYCIGETLEEREAGATLEVLSAQLRTFLEVCETHKDTPFTSQSWVAYEPVWAIGTGKTAELEDISIAHTFINETIISALGHPLPLLYGGSVKPQNTCGILGTPFVDGVLVGSASNNSETFGQLIDEAMR